MTMMDLPPSLISTLPGEYYTDSGLFALEQERVFEAMWFCVARAAELAKPGQFRTTRSDARACWSPAPGTARSRRS